MNRQITIGQYRTIDLLIMAFMLVASQCVIFFASNVWFTRELYVVSPVAGITALVMMRWNGYGAVHAVLGGAVFAWLAKGAWDQLIIYCVGNLAAVLALVMFKLFDKERIRRSGWLSFGFAFCVQIFMLIGRAGVAALFGNSAAVCIRFITTDSLSMVFTLVIIWIVRRVEGLFEDQKNYLLRIDSERQVEGRE